jgi:3-deoxy-D-manno-octulosonic-acid transferase
LLNLVYLSVIAVCLPLIIWQSYRTGKYRDGFRAKFLGTAPRRVGHATCVWLHAVSVGEVNLLATLLRELRAAHPDWQFVVSTTSRTGYELACRKYADLTVFYCPLDFSWAVRNAVRRVRPTMLILAELELWPNLISAAKAHGARVAIINGRLSDHSFPAYRRIRPFMARVLKQIDLIAAQTEESAERFRALGAEAECVSVTGSLKYDGAQTDRKNPRTMEMRRLATITDNDVVFLAGSTQEPEEQYTINVFRRLVLENPRLRLILVPRHPERFEAVAALLDANEMPWQRRSLLVPPDVTGVEDHRGDRAPSRIGGSLALHPSHPSPRILLVDTVGELGAWWGTATIAFVGGSFGSRGGQNMIEPAAYGVAVSFGPNTRNFRDIVASLRAADAAVTLQTFEELESFVRRCLNQPGYAAALGKRAQELVRSQLGATDRTVTLLQELLRRRMRTASIRSAA